MTVLIGLLFCLVYAIYQQTNGDKREAREAWRMLFFFMFLSQIAYIIVSLAVDYQASH